MMEAYDVPIQDRVCRAFAFAAMQTWSELRDFGELGEDSITDYRILQLRRMCPEEVRVIKFSRRKEAETGADWEWWFGSAGEWFGMRVQAKRLKIDSLEYEHLDYTIGKSGVFQVDRLVADARSRQLYPMYCLYNYWPSNECSLDWPCGTFAPRSELWGVSIADARLVQSKVKDSSGKAQKKLDDIGPICFPLMCIACCRGRLTTGPHSLPHRARGTALAISQDPDIVPALISNLPPYITQQGRAEAADVSMSVPDLDGILIVEENPDVYDRAYTRK